jgi:hypothetical protein
MLLLISVIVVPWRLVPVSRTQPAELPNTFLIGGYGCMFRTIIIDIYSKMFRTIMTYIYSKMFRKIMIDT